MNKKVHKVLGKSLVVVFLVALAIMALGSVPSVHAETETIRLGQTVNGWIPSGEEIHWYKFEASPQTTVKITMTRKERDLAPYLALRSYEDGEYKILVVDHNYDRSSAAQVEAVLPPSDNGYWIEAASVGTTAGTFSLTLSTESTWHQGSGNDSSRTAAAYKVTFYIDKVVCHNPQDGDNTDELDFEYSMVEQGPYGTAVDDVSRQKDMWMQQGFVFDSFAPLTIQVPANSGVSFSIKLREDDQYPNKDEMLASGGNHLSDAKLAQMAVSGAREPILWTIADTGTGQYGYEIVYSFRVEKVYALKIS
ncbi:MAG: hypothetical protein R3293_17175 [Candidatus Promineifilaceae bacterium]|nr:hypothetical protein [Candidatus Promineifilaceae bacterium]